MRLAGGALRGDPRLSQVFVVVSAIAASSLCAVAAPPAAQQQAVSQQVSPKASQQAASQHGVSLQQSPSQLQHQPPPPPQQQASLIRRERSQTNASVPTPQANASVAALRSQTLTQTGGAQASEQTGGARPCRESDRPWDCALCAGEVVEANGKKTCNRCAVGHWRPRPLDAASSFRSDQEPSPWNSYTCMDCSSGPTDVSVGPCVPCDGQVVQRAGGLVCEPCPIGSYPLDGEDDCAVCPGMVIRRGGHAVCEPCPEGHYKDVDHYNSSDVCLPCYGVVLRGPGLATSCHPCPHGFGKRGQFDDRCSHCMGALEGQEERGDVCVPCPPGYHRPQDGKSDSCVLCEGAVVRNAGGHAVACQICPDGWYRNIQVKTDNCERCRGHVQRDAATGYASTCLPCAAGFYKANLNDDLCSPCPGKVGINAEGAPHCDGLPPLASYDPLIPPIVVREDRAVEGQLRDAPVLPGSHRSNEGVSHHHQGRGRHHSDKGCNHGCDERRSRRYDEHRSRGHAERGDGLVADGGGAITAARHHNSRRARDHRADRYDSGDFDSGDNDGAGGESRSSRHDGGHRSRGPFHHSRSLSEGPPATHRPSRRRAIMSHRGDGADPGEDADFDGEDAGGELVDDSGGDALWRKLRAFPRRAGLVVRKRWGEDGEEERSDREDDAEATSLDEASSRGGDFSEDDRREDANDVGDEDGAEDGDEDGAGVEDEYIGDEVADEDVGEDAADEDGGAEDAVDAVGVAEPLAREVPSEARQRHRALANELEEGDDRDDDGGEDDDGRGDDD